MFLTRCLAGFRSLCPLTLWIQSCGGGASCADAGCIIGFGSLQDGVRPRGEHLLAGGAAVPGRVRHRGHQGEIPSLVAASLRSVLSEGRRAVSDRI